ncbi:NnrT protein [Tritonibacter mobilis]|uniref:NnrT protein n=1 Tax=Tritonibacter mobilis TaxID=379347 RepID=UPI0013B381C4|nr:NnrT protein [Tritonibacter mobilis]
MTRRVSWKLVAGLYPFATGAVAINVFFASLIGSWLGWDVLTPQMSIVIGGVLGLPAAWMFARHIRRLIIQAENT